MLLRVFIISSIERKIKSFYLCVCASIRKFGIYIFDILVMSIQLVADFVLYTKTNVSFFYQFQNFKYLCTKSIMFKSKYHQVFVFMPIHILRQI